MNHIYNFFKSVLVVKLGILVRDTYTYIKERNYIKDTLYSDNFKFVIKKYVGLTLKKDWIGRLYGVINPLIDINGNINVNSTIIEIDGQNTNNNVYVEQWVYKQMRLIGDLFRINNLYDYINIGISHVGPENHDNYLVVIDIVARRQFVHTLKSVIKHIAIYALLGVGIYYALLKFGII